MIALPGLRRRAMTLLLVFGLVTCSAAGASSAPHSGIWVHVDTRDGITEIRRGDESILRLEEIAFGRGGVSDLHLNGDGTTPRGEYRITHFNQESRFHRFIGINYPTLRHLDRARARGRISDEAYWDTLDAGLRMGRFPQDGPLGGHIGFHGIGNGDHRVHQAFNWTQGCVAMTNAQIETLMDWVRVGTPVIIE
ncbi:L,D-transpeptidase family protein [Spiribacter roseus]|mgnify:CR=1 FL=1|jgi:murein L,D-transpeptidase YafK|uniref:L,D-transpeptidase n=1 Tax=Spiribacter roseus TaxID=1855875 RepID=A0ABV3RWM9_9GAMM